MADGGQGRERGGHKGPPSRRRRVGQGAGGGEHGLDVGAADGRHAVVRVCHDVAPAVGEGPRVPPDLPRHVLRRAEGEELLDVHAP